MKDVANGPASPVVTDAPEGSTGQEAGAEGAGNGDDDAPARGSDGAEVDEVDVEVSPTLATVEGPAAVDLDDPRGADETESVAIQAQEGSASEDGDGSNARGGDELESGSVEETPVGQGDGAGVVDV